MRLLPALLRGVRVAAPLTAWNVEEINHLAVQCCHVAGVLVLLCQLNPAVLEQVKLKVALSFALGVLLCWVLDPSDLGGRGSLCT